MTKPFSPRRASGEDAHAYIDMDAHAYIDEDVCAYTNRRQLCMF